MGSILHHPNWPALDEDAFRILAATHLLSAPVVSQTPVTGPGPRPSDYDLNPSVRPADATQLRPAAVLVPIVIGAPLNVLLTQRTTHLAAHAGQIAFPGGKIEPQDETPLAAALREAQEEIGLDPGFVEPLGYVEPYETSTGFLVTPVVAAVKPGFSLRPDPHEVADIFTVPLAFLLDEANHRIDARDWRGAKRHFYAIPHEGRYIWGATAGIIRALHRRLTAA
ncbi:MAG: CoA pyrophosphatase [Hyphomicrobium sp.]|nr:CoA pyrophosphatase [Hyphomicrobium sp.]